MLLLFFLLALPILLIFHHLYKPKTRRPPGPRGYPIIGNLPDMLRATDYSHKYLTQLSQKYGPLMSLKLGFVPTLVVSSAEMAKEIMKTHDLTFSNRPTLVGQQRLSYNGLDIAFSPHNENWRMFRKIWSLHLFNPKTTRSFRPVREEEVSKMIVEIKDLSCSSKVVDLSEMILTLTSNIICRIAFGKIDEEGDKKSKFRMLFSETQGMFLRFFYSDYFPFMNWLDKVTGLWGRLEKHFKEMDLFYQEIIDQHLDPKWPSSTQKDIIDIFLQIRKDYASSFDITNEHIKAVLMNVLVGATDTTAVTIIWTMVCLIKNPEAMKKAQEEIRRTVGTKGMVDEDDLVKLPYFNAMMKEAMRLHPPAPLLVQRETTQKCIINGYEIAPKTLVYVNMWAIGRDPESWENPEEFSPERFLNSNIEYKTQDFKYIPFGGGRRICPGLDVGIVTVGIVLANLLYSFDWKLPNGMNKEDIDTDSIPGLATHKKNALFLQSKIYNPDLIA